VELELTEDQQLLQATTRRFLDETCSSAQVRALAETAPPGYDPQWWQRGAELGWTSLMVPEELGGGSVSGHGLLDLMLVAEEVGRRIAPGPLIPCNLVAHALATAGSEDQMPLLAPLLEGRAVAAWCLTEPGEVGTPAGVTARAEVQGETLVLEGRKGPVEGAAAADLLLVTARSADGLTQVVLPARHPGVTVTPVHSLDLVRRFAMVDFDAVAVPPGAVLGAVGEAGPDVERQWHLALALQCAEMVGAADEVFGFTCRYAFDRYSFGRPLASYQALKHRFADMKMWLEACHATTSACGQALVGGQEDAAELVSVAKSYVGDHAPRILQDCVQLHGGIGVTWEHDLHLYLRRVVQDRVLFGTPAEQRDHIATLIGM
jgi:alkylation response protein AidB-like acyl-CoA dehydrogenase